MEQGIKVAFEYHANTLTDTRESAYRLLKEINHPNIYSYWQPPVGWSMEECLDGLNKILPWLTHVHTYQWKEREKRPLEEGVSIWTEYMKVIKQVEGDRYSMIELIMLINFISGTTRKLSDSTRYIIQYLLKLDSHFALMPNL